MTHISYRAAGLASALAIAVSGAGMARAAESGASDLAAAEAGVAPQDDMIPGGEIGNTIIVTGTILASQQASVEAKRKADNLSDIAAADAVGRFPDQNAAAALARLPAVAVQRDQGQERYIQVRGAPNRWTSVSIDGIPMVGVDEGGDTRAYRFDAIPAVMLSEMVVNKSLTSDMQADAIVATIDLRTYSPMEQRGLHVSGDLGYGFMGLGGGEQRQGSLRLSWSNDNFGFVLGGSHYRRKQLTDNREVGAYDANGPTEFDIRQYELERWNNGLFGAVEYSPEAGQRIYAKAIFSEFNDDEQRNQYELRLDKAAGGTRGFSSGDLTGVPMRGSFNYGEYRNRNYIGTIGGEYDDLDGFTAAVKLNYTRTENSSYLPLVQSSTSGADNLSFSYDASNPNFPIVSLTSGAFNQASLSVAGTYMIGARQETVSDSYTAKVDFSKEMGDLTLSGGGLYADRDIAGNNFSFSNLTFLGALGSVVGQPFDVNSYVTDKAWDTDFPLGLQFNYVDNVAMRRDIDSLLARLETAGLYDPAADIPASDRYAQREKTLAGYVSAKLETGALTAIAGLRVENYVLDNSGSVLSDGAYTPLTFHKSRTDFFPSLNLKYEASNDVVLRLAGQRGVSRPAYGAIRVGASINDTASPGEITGGNPLLKPEYTWGLDASVEYYLPGNGLLSVAGFSRWVDNVLYSSQQPVGSDFYSFGGVDRSGYLLSGTFNGKHGKLYGVEFNAQKQFDFLPAPLDGFGFQGNLTLLDGDFDTPTQEGIPFQGMSKTIANASLFYEKYGFSGRVSYQWRSHWLDTLGGLGSGEYRQGYENLDVSLRYAVNENFTLFADLANLTNETYIAYANTPATPTEVERIGSRYLFGVRFGF
ncbi:TonB-dependent receptor [Novosphingobium pentaromativorans]|uniref:TonB-dependent receptor n=1 Tax=Novosphingobium pentaromativorans US6-1 TaxID=1088721 RepID=G6ECM4_9SPHN|nr:TonB-dependent receptor [Novosphingobium pentaromativorans]AIT80016.1 TonB-dependent receptor [Novosphingobium pentaromativorans US6-1]EHJ60935.1 TonB-dependent receptor [Novosphingobium pentaromativorans US6-1]